MSDEPETAELGWNTVQVFGQRLEVAPCVVRASAYGLIADAHGHLAIVQTSRGAYLPGGGRARGETAVAAIIREAQEECGLLVHPGKWTERAIQFVYSAPEQTHFEKRSVFIECTVAGPTSSPREADHELLWLTPQTAARTLSHESHRWAVACWLNRAASK